MAADYSTSQRCLMKAKSGKRAGHSILMMSCLHRGLMICSVVFLVNHIIAYCLESWVNEKQNNLVQTMTEPFFVAKDNVSGTLTGGDSDMSSVTTLGNVKLSNTEFQQYHLPFILAEGVVGLGAVILNAFLLLAVIRFRDLHCPTNVFVGSRALADLLFGIVIFIAVLVPFLDLVNEFYSCLIIKSALVFISNVSILTLVGIAFDRFMAVRCPFRYYSVVTIKSAYCISAGIWMVGLIVAVILAILHKSPSTFTHCFFEEVLDVRVMNYLIFFPIFIPVMTSTMTAFAYIFYVVRKKKLLEQALVASLRQGDRQELKRCQQKVRGMTGLVLIVAAHLVCWLPLGVFNLVLFFSLTTCPWLHDCWLLLRAFIVLSHICCILNPLLYINFNSKIKIAVKSLIFSSSLQSHLIWTTMDRIPQTRISHRQIDGRLSLESKPSSTSRLSLVTMLTLVSRLSLVPRLSTHIRDESFVMSSQLQHPTAMSSQVHPIPIPTTSSVDDSGGLASSDLSLTSGSQSRQSGYKRLMQRRIIKRSPPVLERLIRDGCDKSEAFIQTLTLTESKDLQESGISGLSTAKEGGSDSHQSDMSPVSGATACLDGGGLDVAMNRLRRTLTSSLAKRSSQVFDADAACHDSRPSHTKRPRTRRSRPASGLNQSGGCDCQ